MHGTIVMSSIRDYRDPCLLTQYGIEAATCIHILSTYV